MNYLLFAVYLLILCWLMIRVPFIKKTGISSKHILILFLLKILAGIAIGWLSLHYYGTGNDYWDVNREGWKEYQLLMSNPGEYFTNLFKSGYTHGYGGLFDSFQSFWTDLKNNIIIKLVSVFDIFSRGDYYINSLFFNFIIFFGHVALYRIFTTIYKGQYWPVIAGCFLLPSMLYFTSGIHKDGIVFLMLAILLYQVFFSLQQNRLGIKRILSILAAAVLLFLTRNFIFILLMPALFAWILAAKMKWSPLVTFVGVYIVAGLLLFNFTFFSRSIDPLQTIVQKQTDYLHLPPSATVIKLDSLSPNFKSFLYHAPQSFNHVLLRPYLFELPSTILLPMNIEVLAYEILFILFLFFRRKGDPDTKDVFTWFAVFFTLTAFLFIGYIAPNLGSLVRYRSLFLPLLITPLICRINWEKLGKAVKVIK